MLLQHWPSNNKPHVYEFLLQHADSEGALLGDRCSLQPASSVSSTLASSLGQPLAEQQSVEDFITTSTNGCDVRVGSSPTERALEPEEVKEAEDEDEEGNIYKEDILMGDDQVADFASSVLAAISCWQYRSRALLSTQFTTVRVSHIYVFPISCSIQLALPSVHYSLSHTQGSSHSFSFHFTITKPLLTPAPLKGLLTCVLLNYMVFNNALTCSPVNL